MKAYNHAQKNHHFPRAAGIMAAALLLMTDSGLAYWAEDLQATPTRGIESDYRQPAPVDQDTDLRQYRSPDPGQMILHDNFKFDHKFPRHQVPTR